MDNINFTHVFPPSPSRSYSYLYSALHPSSYTLLMHLAKKSKDAKSGVTTLLNRSISHSIYFLWFTFLYE